MKRATLLPSAKADLIQILVYVATRSQSIRTAQNFDQRIRAHCHHLASLPFKMGTDRSDLVPEMRSSVFEGYVIFFQYARNRFEVVNIIEGHRDMAGYFSESNSE